MRRREPQRRLRVREPGRPAAHSQRGAPAPPGPHQGLSPKTFGGAPITRGCRTKPADRHGAEGRPRVGRSHGIRRTAEANHSPRSGPRRSTRGLCDSLTRKRQLGVSNTTPRNSAASYRPWPTRPSKRSLCAPWTTYHAISGFSDRACTRWVRREAGAGQPLAAAASAAALADLLNAPWSASPQQLLRPRERSAAL